MQWHQHINHIHSTLFLPFFHHPPSAVALCPHRGGQHPRLRGPGAAIMQTFRLQLFSSLFFLILIVFKNKRKMFPDIKNPVFPTALKRSNVPSHASASRAICHCHILCHHWLLPRNLCVSHTISHDELAGLLLCQQNLLLN